MASRNVLVLLLVVLCASQLAQGHSERERQKRGIGSFMWAAGSKLGGMLGGVKDAVGSAFQIVIKMGTAVETIALDAASTVLRNHGINADLRSIVDLFKSNIKGCIQDDAIQSKFGSVKDELVSCVSLQTAQIQDLQTKMKTLWEAAENMPEVMKAVAAECEVHIDEAPSSDVDIDAVLSATVTADTTTSEDSDLHTAAAEIIGDAQRVLSKRATWGVDRAIKCIKSVYDLTQSDLKAIPAEIMTYASEALSIVNSAKDAAPGCIVQKLSSSADTLKGLAAEFGKCSLQGVKEKAVSELFGKTTGVLKAIADVAPTLLSAVG